MKTRIGSSLGLPKKSPITIPLIGLLAVVWGHQASAATTFDASVTSNIIFGTSNLNGAFTVDRTNGIELGLRSKLRFNAANNPENTFNSNGDGTYDFDSGQPAGGGFGFALNSPSTAIWNFEWSVNSNFDGSTASNLDAFTYLLEIDFDPSPGTIFLAFDPINPAAPGTFGDHAIGTNATGDGAGTVAADEPGYLALIANNNLAQNSWNMEFFDNAPAFPFDANVEGEYIIRLTALDGGGSTLASTSITVNVTDPVPEPSGVLLCALGALPLLSRRSRR